MIPNFLFFADKPPTPPSYTASVQKENFTTSLKMLIKSKEYIYLVATFTLYYGGLNILAVIVSFLIKPFGYNDSVYASIISSSIIVSGLIGSLISGKFV